MKERNRKGKFRAAETVAYKMTQHYGFDQVSWQAFQEAAAEKYDFASSACPKGEKMTFGKCQKTGKAEDTEVAVTRTKKNLGRLNNQKRRKHGLPPKK